MKGPLMKLPGNREEFQLQRVEAEERVKELVQRERSLKDSYVRTSKQLQAEISKLNRDLRESKARLGRFQRENRTARKKLAEERIRLKKDLSTLQSRYNSMIRRTREKVRRQPGEAFELMERV